MRADVTRSGQPQALTLKLDAGWRRKGDISWRASTWGLRRQALGGMFVVPLSADERPNDPAIGLKVQHVGQFAPHDRAHQAGVRKGDLLVSFAGRTDLRRETDLIAYALAEKKPGDHVTLELLRDGKPLTVRFTLPK